QLAERRQHLVPHARARETNVLVGRVVAPLEAALLAVGAGLRAGRAQQRADQALAPRRHSEQRAPAWRYGEPVQHGLGLVGGGVGGGVVALRVALGQLVAAVARLGLEVPGHLTGSGLQLDPLHRERNARGLARAAAQLGV